MVVHAALMGVAHRAVVAVMGGAVVAAVMAPQFVMATPIAAMTIVVMMRSPPTKAVVAVPVTVVAVTPLMAAPVMAIFAPRDSRMAPCGVLRSRAVRDGRRRAARGRERRDRGRGHGDGRRKHVGVMGRAGFLEERREAACVGAHGGAEVRRRERVGRRQRERGEHGVYGHEGSA